jgi:NADH-quinone oxidoreductase subunit L
MLRNVWLIPFLPAASFAAIVLFGKRLPGKGAPVGILAVGTSLVLSIVAVFQWIDHVDAAEGGEHGLRAFFGQGFVLRGGEEHGAFVEPVTRTFTWWQSGGVKFEFGTMVDGLTVMMLFVVTLVSFLVHIYSTNYMEGDRRFTHYYAFLSLFTASMLLLVVSDNLLELLVGWELVGLCSFVLIGHWWEEKPNSDAAVKAFLTTRVGDVGLMIGIIILFFGAGNTFNIVDINEAALGGDIGTTVVALGAAGLLIGIMGKSGQFPLHTWLPDAMAGPTPVSALIHAATMVVAGVYLGARMYGVFWTGFSIDDGGLNAMAVVGGITILIGAVLAFVQNDIKRVLAYSTISQIGYMVMGLGVGAWVGAVFHLFTHAFFKALLFLGAGSVSHSGAHHSFDMKRDMGGLRKYMPITFWTFIIGSVALAGLFPFAGFWSKDEILATADQSSFDIFFWVGVIGAFMTAAYMTRCVYLTFFGEYRGHGQPHESGPVLTVPLIVLAVFATITGFANAAADPFNLENFKKYVEPVAAYFPIAEITTPEFHNLTAIISVGVALLGFLLTLAYYTNRLSALHGLTTRNQAAKAGYVFLENKYYLDHLYTNVVVGGIKRPIAKATYWFDQRVVDGAVNGVGAGARDAARGAYDFFDQKVVDGAVNGIADTTGDTGNLLRYVQSGRVQRYALILFAAVGLLSLALFLFT